MSRFLKSKVRAVVVRWILGQPEVRFENLIGVERSQFTNTISLCVFLNINDSVLEQH